MKVRRLLFTIYYPVQSVLMIVYDRKQESGK